ncbi:biotin--[acetyl-CoA-carboxylase] ligase [Alkalicoccobacillus plakortidis]|uniref:Bifunctional ligase/repressor BirA n=1 Tax=Alkalicoccobacillus plakortidis TaxID=444060 RepID=A0ABT0XEP3_9BACI|nr:biotin--[acetyl-CoA-carboxylase] ligase [Alkalicoccobacillus plakortidis]MCM2674359.1 biotin--[acetyl-CoA-carboxylase] ligase [Alkalicoccobacillus plakortidis]
MRSKLVQELVEHQGTYLSGESLSQALGVSRTAIWKQIDVLKKSGYQIDSVPKKGYQLLSRPDGLQEHDLHLYLKSKRLGHTVAYYASVPTTQAIAHDLAEAGSEEGHLVVADEQTGGRGRFGRNWSSAPGTSISMSLLLRPKLAPQQVPQLTLVAAVAVTRAIEKVTQLKADIKWPNDILINGKKIVGILTEMQSEPGLAKVVILGIGINANQSESELNHDNRNRSTSLAIEAGTSINRAKLLAAVLEEFEWLYDTYVEKGFAEIKLLWEARSISIGKQLKAQTINGTITGLSTGISAEGALLLEDDQGIIHTVYSADIE